MTREECNRCEELSRRMRERVADRMDDHEGCDACGVVGNWVCEQLAKMETKIGARQTTPTGTIRARTYPILARAVEDGIAYGWQRAHKHTDTPDADHVKDQIEQAVMSEICEVFEFDEPGED